MTASSVITIRKSHIHATSTDHIGTHVTLNAAVGSFAVRWLDKDEDVADTYATLTAASGRYEELIRAVGPGSDGLDEGGNLIWDETDVDFGVRSIDTANRGNPLLQHKILTALGAVALVVVFASLAKGGTEAGPPAAVAIKQSGPTASDMGCTSDWTLVKTTNGIHIFDCSGTVDGHQTIWRFDDAGAKASFMDTMSRAVRPSGHLIYADQWAVISDSSASFQAAINAGGQDYGS